MANQNIEYMWLTSVLRARDKFFGPSDSRGHPCLLRHGISVLTQKEEIGRFRTLGEEAELVKRGGRHFYLAAVEAEGRPLNVAKAFYLIAWPPDMIVVGDELHAGLREWCNLEFGHALPIDPRSVSVHAWYYEFPSTPDNSKTIQFAIYQATGSRDEEDVGGEHELMRKLCERHPASMDLPQMHVILAPTLLRHTGVEKTWHQDRTVITAGSKSMVRTRRGDMPITLELLRAQPILQYEGFLIPPAAASLFNTGSDCDWPAFTCIKKVTLRVEEDRH